MLNPYSFKNMINKYSFEDLIKLIQKDFDVQVINNHVYKSISFGRNISDYTDISFDGSDLQKEFTITIRETISKTKEFEFRRVNMVDGYIVDGSRQNFSSIEALYNFIANEIKNLKSNLMIKKTNAETLNINLNDLDNEFISRLTILKLNDKYDEFIEAIEEMLGGNVITKIVVSETNKENEINEFMNAIHIKYAILYKRCFADDFYGIDLRIFKDQLMKNLFFTVRNCVHKDRHTYILKQKYA